MDELQMVEALLAGHEPSHDVVARSRQRLQNRMRGPVRRTRAGWWAGGLGLTAAAATAAVVITSGTTRPVPAPNSPPSPQRAAQMSAQQILLTAATTAERTPASSGTYWYVKEVERDSAGGRTYVSERWTRPDGQVWRRDAKTEGKVFHEGLLPGLPRSKPFLLGTDFVSFQQLQNLPTEPDALKAWLADSAKHSSLRTSAGRLTADDQKRAAFESLITLISTLPAPPKVRAAAFRAFASYPNVKNLGPVSGGQSLEFSIPGEPGAGAGTGSAARMVVDPATAQVRETNFLALGGGEEWIADGGGVTLTTNWMDQLPR